MQNMLFNKCKRFALFLTAAVLAVLLASCAPADTSGTGAALTDTGNGENGSGKLSVVTSFYAIYDFASKIGGDRAELVCLTPSGTEPHDWEPSVADIRRLEKAQLFVYSGAGMESWTDDVLASLDNDALVAVKASEGIALLSENNADADPHVWLDPENAKKELENIKNAFVQADPENADYYEANYSTWSAACDALDSEFHDTLAPLPQREIVVAHEAFGYLCNAYGLQQLGIEGLTPDSEPTPAKMAQITDFVKENGVKTIFAEELSSSKATDTIAAETGVSIEVLNPLEGLTPEEERAGADYFSVMRENLQKIAAALR